MFSGSGGSLGQRILLQIRGAGCFDCLHEGGIVSNAWRSALPGGIESQVKASAQSIFRHAV